MIHLEGMGWIGSVLADRLDVEFTWHDDERPSAWRASTGCVYPAGDERSRFCHDVWWSWATPMLRGFVHESPFLVTHKHSLNGRPFAADLGPVRLCADPAYIVDVPGFVEHTRRRFADRRRAGVPNTATRLVRSHGFGSGLTAYAWGWSCLARLVGDVDPAASVYSKPHRFATVYAYSRPDLGGHLIGSAVVRQGEPRRRPVHTGQVVEHLESLAPIVTKVELLDEPKQGWRPCGSQLVFDGIDAIEAPSLEGNGVRWAPWALDEIEKALCG